MVDFEMSRDVVNLARQVFAAGQAVGFRIEGGSMRPFLRSGDTVLVKPAQAQDLRLGDVIVFDPGGRSLIAHRIVQISAEPDGQRYLTQGDATLVPDGWIQPEQVIGTVIARRRDQRNLRLDTPVRRWMTCWFTQILQMVKLVYRSGQKLLRPGISKS